MIPATYGAKSSGGYTPLWNRIVFAANSKNSTHSLDEPLRESLWTFDLSADGAVAEGILATEAALSDVQLFRARF